MTELIFATNNAHKAEEVQAAVGNKIRVITLKQAHIDIDIPEPHDTLEDNAREKSHTIFKLTGKNCFSEDTGLEVNALNGEPGVKSARYAGEERAFEKNTSKLLEKLEGYTDRQARFRTVLSLILNNNEHLFEGICEGTITGEPRGGNGFGYDPVFIPVGSTFTFGEMTLKEKAMFSHRSKAIDQLIRFLEQHV